MKTILLFLWILPIGLGLRAEEIDVVLYSNPPLINLEEGGEPTGIVLDFLRSLEAESDLTFRFRSSSFPEAIEMVRNGEVDMLPAVAFSYDRQSFMKFSKSFLFRNRGVLYRRGGIPFHEMEDLEGKSVALLQSDVHGDAFRELVQIYGLSVDFRVVESYDEAVELLQDQSVDFSVLNAIYGSQIPMDGSIVSTYNSFNPVSLRIGYSPSTSNELIRRIDEALDAQHDAVDSALHRSIAKNFKQERETRIPLYVWVILVSIFGVAVIAVGMSRLLHRIVEQRTEELRIERDRAAAADRAKSHFLGNVSHEIRTPLNGILGFCQLIETSEHLSVQDRESVDAIVESSQRLELVLSAILRYSDLASAVCKVEKDAVVVADLLPEIAEVLCMRFGADRERVEIELKGVEGRTYTTDGNIWYGMLESLIGNALKFGGDSNVVVRLSERGFRKGVSCLHLEVEDSGPGIPLEDRERIFLPFEQLDTSLSRRFEGVGLGLSLVKENVNLLGGTIELRDGMNGGVRVVVEIPV
tara:strand:+ start:2630 stop:4207 length:1578 start_codon:yes stop_codon:yes gene_type:complete